MAPIMKSATLAAGLFSAAAVAFPTNHGHVHHDKRAVATVWETYTHVVTVTVTENPTWAAPTPAAPPAAPSSPAAPEQPSQYSAAPVEETPAASPAPVASSSAAPPPPPPAPSSSSPVAPVVQPTPSQPAPVVSSPAATPSQAPAPVETPVQSSLAAPAPAESTPAQAVPSQPAAQPSEAAPSQPAAQPSEAAPAAPSGTPNSHASTPFDGKHVGKITYYDPAGGLTSCGTTFDTNTQNVVALNMALSGPASNNNPLCGRQIRASYNGKTTVGTVEDKCAGCDPNHIDVSAKMLKELGIVDMAEGVEWELL
ncbi:hypothetical protein KEM52_001256 [Ascosphaera acerosa]|nr:hypothetical protein KEM52_001256 [Ascosphaera acerosa]